MLYHIWAFPRPQFLLKKVPEQVMAWVPEPKSTTVQQRKSAQLLPRRPGRPGSDSPHSPQHILAAHCPTSLAGPGDLESLELANPSTTASLVTLLEAPWPPLAASSAGCWAKCFDRRNPHATGIPPSHQSGPSCPSRPSHSGPSRTSHVLSSRSTHHPAEHHREES